MTIDEAINNRTTYLQNSNIPKSTADYNATLLSIEALDCIRVLRIIPDKRLNLQLASETN